MKKIKKNSQINRNGRTSILAALSFFVISLSLFLGYIIKQKIDFIADEITGVTVSGLNEDSSLLEKNNSNTNNNNNDSNIDNKTDSQSVISNGAGYILANLVSSDGSLIITNETGKINLNTSLGTSIDMSSETNLRGGSGIVLKGNTLSIAQAIARDSELHEALDLSGEADYITLDGQTIVRNLIDLNSHVTGILPVASGGTGVSDGSPIFNNLTLNGNQILNGTLSIRETGLTPNFSTTFFGADQNENIIYTLPASAPENNGYVLTAQTDGTMSWSLVSGTSGVSGIGAVGQVAYWSGTNTITGENYLSVSRGGTGLNASAVTDGQILIGNNATNDFSLASITQGNGIIVTNGTGTITIASTLGTTIDISSETNLVGDGEIILTGDSLSIAASIARDSELHNAVTLAGQSYLSIVGQVISAGIVELGTHTSGNYVAGLTPGTAITISGTAAEGWSPTVGVSNDSIGDTQLTFNTGQDLTNVSTPTFGGLTLNGNQTITGTLGIKETGTTPTYFTTFQGGDQGANITYTLPTSNTNGLMRNTAGVLTWDTNTYLTGNQTITLSGDVTGTGTTAITATVVNDSHDHSATTLPATISYLGSQIDVSDETNLAVGGVLLVKTDDTLSIKEGALTSGRLCTYDTLNGLVCNTESSTVGHSAVTINAIANGLSVDGSQVLTLALANTTTTGALSSTDWNTFNNKQNALTLGDITGTANQVAISGGVGAIIGTGVSLSLPQDIATTSAPTFGGLTLNGNQTITGTLGIKETGDTPTFFTTFQGGDQGANITYTLPTSQAAGANYVLANDGNGALSWQLASTGTMTNPMNTLGDIIYGGDAGAPTRLAGAAGFLTSSGSAAPAWTSFATDSFTQYALLAGRIGGQTLIGGTAANDTLVLQGNSATIGNTLTNIGMQFNVGDSGSTNAITILNNGNVGIGTTSPLTMLELANNGILRVTGGTTPVWPTSGAGFELAYDSDYNNGMGIVGLSNFVSVDRTGGAASYKDMLFSASNLVFRAGGITETMTLRSTGNVGIGTTTPGAKLDINGNMRLQPQGVNSYVIDLVNGDGTAGSGGLLIKSNQTATASFRLLPDNDNIWFQNTNSAGNIYFSGLNGSDLTGNVIFKGSGNVGIGIASPAASLNIKAGTAAAGTAPLKFTSGVLNTVAEAGAMEFDGTNLYFSPSAGNRMTIGYSEGIYGSGTIGYLPRFTAANSLGNSILYDSGSAISVAGNIMPEMTGAIGSISNRNIGDENNRFAHIWAEDVHIGANSLYVNGKKVISDVSSVMNFTTDIDQSMIVKSMGIGSLGLQSDQGTLFLNSNSLISANGKGGISLLVPADNPSMNLNLSNNSLNGNITLNGTGANSQILASALQKISLTSPSIEFNGAVTIGTWQGSSIGVAYGGTGLTAYGIANQLMGMNATGNALEYKTINGTTNQITVTNGANSLTLSLPQNIHATATPTFGGLTINGNQAITGNLGLNASSYINFGGTDGDIGYGFRDNGGIMEFKNSSGSWATFGAGSGSSTFLGLTDTPGAYTVGSILFTSGSAVTQDNANLFWDDANNRLGIGMITPTEMLDVAGNIQAGGYFSLSNLATAPLAPSNHGILYNVASSSSDSNSKLLLHANGPDNSTTFLDSSSSAHVMTTAGDARMSNIQYKFGGSSAYFDGSGDYIQTADSPDWDFSGDFTIDFWGKHNAISAYSTFLEIGSWTNSLLIRQDGASSFCLHFNSVSYCNTYSPNLDWHHYAIVRSGGFIKIFVDGVQIGSDISNNLNFQPANVLRVGSSVHSVGQYLNGYVDEFRISKGIARWTSNFTPPTTEYDQDSSGYFAYRDSSGTVTPLVGNGAAWRFAGANIYNNFSNIGIGTASPTALLNIKAGTATAGTAPLKFTSGTNLTTTEAGAVEFDGAHLYFTATNGGTRYQLDQQTVGGGLTNPMTTIGDIIYGGDSGAPARLAGAAGFLTSTGSAAPAWTSFVTDSFTQYALLAGRVGGQTLIGGTAANNTLTLQGNSATTGNTSTNIGMQFKVGNSGATNALTILNNGNMGLGIANPEGRLHLFGNDASSASLIFERQSSDIYGPYLQFRKGRVGDTAAVVNDYLGGNTWLINNSASNYSPGAGIWSYAENVTAGSESAGIDFLTTTDGTITGLRSSDIKMRITGGGKVGIGTTSPTANLDVVGSGGIVFRSSGSSSGFTIMDRPTVPGDQLVFQGNAGNYSLFNVATKNANIGTEKLSALALWTVDILNASNATQFQVQNSPTYGGVFFTEKFSSGSYDPSGTKGISFQTNWSQGVTPTQLVLNANGKVGIGTASPTALLNIKAGTATAGTAPLKFTSGTNLTTTEAGAIEFDGAHLYFTATNGGTRYQLDQQAGGLANPMTTLGDIIYGGASGAPTRLAAAAGFLTSTGSAAPAWTSFATDSFAQYALLAGRAGGQTLIGGTAANNTLLLQANSASSGNTLTNIGMQFKVGDSGATNALTVLNNGNIGIGTTSPEKKLHIYGDIGTDFLFQVESPNANANFLLLADTAGQAQSFSFRNVSAGGDGWNIANNASGNLVITSRAASINTDRFTLLSSGNVGIGTVSPRNKLDVSGAIMATGASVNTPVANGIVLSSETSYDQLQSYNSRSLYINPLGNNVIFNRDSGRIGISTATPGTLNGTSFASIKLQAYNASASTYAAIDTGLSNGEAGFLLNRGAASANNRMWGIASRPVPDTTTSALGFSTYSDAGTPTTLMTILRNGNVGIGTTNPATKLNVVGAISTADGTNGYMTMNTDDSAARTGFLEWRLGSGTRLGFMGDSASNIALALENNANFVIGGGNVGIGTDTPGAKLDIGSAGTSLGTLRLAGDTSGYVQLQPAAAAGSWTMTLPAAVGTAGQQLTDVNGDGITSWTAAGSLRILKDIDNMVTDPNIALNQLLETNIYNFHYKEGMGTGDSDTQYVGVMADESPWAMHYDGRVINPVNTLGYMVLGVKALNNKIEISDTSFEEYVSQTEQTITTLALKTDSDATTLLQLQTSVDTQLAIVQESINNLVITNDDFETRIATLEAASEGNGLLISQLATQMEEIRAQVAEVDFVEMNDKLNSLLSFLDASDGVVKIDVLEATITETGALVIKNSDDEAPTIGTAIICPAMIELGADNKCSLVQTDGDNDGLDDETGHAVNDGKRVMVKTAAVKGASKVFMTIKSKLTQEATLMVTDIVENNNFTVELVNPTQEEVTFDWWIVEAK